jgi:enoyl ACP reductase
MEILEGKKLLITGVLTEKSIAFSTARAAQQHGAEVILSGFGRGMSITKRTARRLPVEPEILEIDVTNPEHLRSAAAELATKWDKLDGILHAIAYGPKECLDDIVSATWDQVAVAMHVSTFSLKELVTAFHPLLAAAGQNGGAGASVIGLDFDASVAWPIYNWMGVTKAALESLTRYLARDMGPDHIRVNLIAAGPIRTTAANAVPGFNISEDVWEERAPLGWNNNDSSQVADACVALFSDLLRMTTGEILHVDGGVHAIGA